MREQPYVTKSWPPRPPEPPDLARPKMPPCSPPDYMLGEACDLCWEVVGVGWLHRLKWGHWPVPLLRVEPPDGHAENIRHAAAWREYRARGL